MRALFLLTCVALTACSRCAPPTKRAGAPGVKAEDTGTAAQNLTGGPIELPECDVTETPHFKALTNLDKVEAIVPPGSLVFGEGLMMRSFVILKSDLAGEDAMVPVYAPTKATLVSGSYFLPEGGLVAPHPLYSLSFEATCALTLRFDQLVRVAPKIADALPSKPTSARSPPETVKVDVEGGELIGYADATAGAHDWHFSVTDRNHENAFVNVERYRKDSMLWAELHTACPYDYFESPLKEAYLAKISDYASPPPEKPTCRSVSQDKAGTIAGNWFLEGAPDANFAPRLYVRTEFDGTIRIVGVGQTFGSIRIGAEEASNKAPDTVTTTHCYDLSGPPVDGDPTHAFVFFKLEDPMTISVAFASGEYCPTVLPSGARTYKR